MSRETTRPPGHLPALDGVRGLAVLIVVLYHVPVQWRRYTHVGFVGVDLFFVLSGFLITGILLDAKGSRGALRSFYARRALRILPLYYGFLILYFVFLAKRFPELGRPPPAGWYFAHLSNVYVAKVGTWTNYALDPTWSLAIEEQFYLLWPAVVHFSSRRTLAWICAGLSVLALALRFAAACWLRVGPIPLFVLTPLHVEGLALGAAVALAARGEGGIDRLVPAARRVGALLGVVLGAIWIYGAIVDQPYLSYDRTALSTVVLTPMSLLCAAVLVLVLARAGIVGRSRLWTLSPLRALGKYSYAVYLFHLPIERWLAIHVMPRLPWGQLRHVAFFAATLALSVAAAVVTWHLYEKQLLRLKAWFPYRAKLDGGATWTGPRRGSEAGRR